MQKQRSSSNAIFLSTNDQRLLCHGQLWAPQEEIFHEAERGADYNSRINWPDGIIAEKNGKKALDYFNLFFPFQELPNILCYTNKVMSYKKYTPNVEYAELLRWIGIRLLGALEKIEETLRITGNFTVEGLPHVTKIIRKPKGIGAELKALADGDTGCLIAVEIQEGKEQMATKEFTRELGSDTALTLRLCKHYFGSERIVIGDSAFSSLKTLMELRKRNCKNSNKRLSVKIYARLVSTRATEYT